MENSIQTRKDETRYTTSDIDGAIGMFIAEPARRTWLEDFIDSNTGEVMHVERHEILFKKGTFIDADVAQQLKFRILCGDLEEIEVSNQRRIAAPYPPRSLYPYRVNATVGSKKYTFILQAHTAQKAIEVATDYIELTYTNDFDITAVKLLDSLILLNDRLITEEEAALQAETDSEEEEKRDDAKYYKVETEMQIPDETSDAATNQKATFIVRTKEVDTAKAVINAWIVQRINNMNQEDGGNRKLENLAVISAVPFHCNFIIDRAFCLAYQEAK